MISSTSRTPEVSLADSKQLGALIGPTLGVILLSELPLIQPHLYDAQIPPVIYLSGVIMFVAGLAVVRAHNVWEKNWTVLITLTGWFLLLLGLIRMFAASQYQLAIQRTHSTTFILLEICLLVVALIITFKANGRAPTPTK
jgi:membrane protein CcdC involved in cytochrome C biogenesis